MNEIKILFMTIGIIFTVSILIVTVILITTVIRSGISNLHIRHVIKNRFDKPPIAKRYCKDCKY